MNSPNSVMPYLFVRHNERLAMYKQSATREHWETRHRTSADILRHQLRSTKQILQYQTVFRRWLPHRGIILDAGSGKGIWVKRLRENGWNCIGLDFDMATLSRSKVVAPSLPLLGGDVYQLPFADNSLAAYISLGVVEHDFQGPQHILEECARALGTGGVALISVPFENPLRKNLPIVNATEAISSGLKFYQYYFTKEDLQSELVQVGLKPVKEFHGYSVSLGLIQAVPILRHLLSYLGGLSVFFDFVPGLSRLAAHMIFGIAVKP